MGDVQMDKNTKQIKVSKAQQEETVLNRLLCWLTGGAVLEFLLLLLNRYYNDYTSEMIALSGALRTVVKIVAVVALACAAVLMVRWRAQRRRGEGTLWSGVGAAFLLGLSLSCFATWLVGPNGLRCSYVAVPVAIVLIAIYYLYQREFFFQSCCAALALMGIWIISNGRGSSMRPFAYAYAIVATAMILFGIVLYWKAQGNQGEITFRGQSMRLFPPDANYPLLYAGAAIHAAVIIAALFFTASVVLYGTVTACVLIMAVYYTVKII